MDNLADPDDINLSNRPNKLDEIGNSDGTDYSKSSNIVLCYSWLRWSYSSDDLILLVTLIVLIRLIVLVINSFDDFNFFFL